MTSLQFVPEKLSGPLSLGTRLIFRQAANHWPGPMVLPRDSELVRRFKALTQLARISKASGGGTPELMTLIAPVLAELKELLTRDRHPNEMAGNRVLAILDGMDEGDAQGVSVAELARRCGCSRRHLSRIIRENCGCALASIRIELRLDKAARLLRNSENKIIDVAMECGFNHLGSFAARFRGRFGATPGEWRKTQNGNGQHSGIIAFPRLAPEAAPRAGASAKHEMR
jgi:AraC-like DNA-binding protein